MLVVERPGRIKIHGKDLRVVDPQAEAEATAMTELVRDTEGFFFCDGPEQRMLLAVAGVCDGYGIASGWDPEAGLARGVSVASLALKAGLGRAEAEEVLAGLCAPGRDLLCRLVTKYPPYGLVWVLLGVDVEAVPA